MSENYYKQIKIVTDVQKAYAKALKSYIYSIKVAIKLDQNTFHWDEYFYRVEIGEWEALDEKVRERNLLIFTQAAIGKLLEKCKLLEK